MSTGYQRSPRATTQTVEPNGDGLLDQVLQATSAHRYSIPEMEKIAQKAAASRMFGGGEDGGSAMSPDQAFMMCLIAEATGIHPALALLRYDIVMGKPAMKSAFVLAEFQRLGGVVDWEVSTEEVVRATFTSKRHPRPFTIELTLQQLKDRKVAMVYDRKNETWKLKHMYANHPRSMLRWRAAVEAIRATDPGIFMGMYADCEAEDMERPAVAESPAREALVSHLAGRRENPKDLHPPVAETAAMLREMPKTEPPVPAKEAETAWGKVIADATLHANQALAQLAEENPNNVALRNALKVQQVVNGVINEFVKDGLDEGALKNDKGKRDAAKVRACMDDLWENDQEGVEGAAAKYIGSKFTELMGPAAAPAQGELAMA